MPITPRQLDELERQAACAHEHRRGGNDYIECTDCGLMWDYRQHGTFVGADKELIKRLLDALLPLVREAGEGECQACHHERNYWCRLNVGHTGPHLWWRKDDDPAVIVPIEWEQDRIDHP